jgi:hypothetical protein
VVFLRVSKESHQGLYGRSVVRSVNIAANDCISEPAAGKLAENQLLILPCLASTIKKLNSNFALQTA